MSAFPARRLCFAFVMASFPGIAFGQMANPAQAEEQYGGVIVNQTVTVAGFDFYQHFVLAWRDRDLSERFTVSVHELPSARWGSRIWVEYAQRRVFEATLPAARAAIKTVSAHAVEVTHQKIADAEVERLLFRNADLGPDEI